jgi:ABC-type uncharacterized transport system permease subunit
MILSFGSAPAAASLSLTAGLIAALAYAMAALAGDSRGRWPTLALLVGWFAHAVALFIDFMGLDEPPGAGARFGFAPVLSGTAWLVLAVHVIESRWLPLPQVRRLLAVLGAVVIILAAAFPGEPHALAGPRWVPLHWMLGVASYGLSASQCCTRRCSIPRNDACASRATASARLGCHCFAWNG